MMGRRLYDAIKGMQSAACDLGDEAEAFCGDMEALVSDPTCRVDVEASLAGLSSMVETLFSKIDAVSVEMESPVKGKMKMGASLGGRTPYLMRICEMQADRMSDVTVSIYQSCNSCRYDAAADRAAALCSLADCVAGRASKMIR